MLVTDNTAQAAVMRELQAGEHLLWSGMPRQGVRFRSGDIFMVPFSLLWGGGVFSGVYKNITSHKEPSASLLFVLPFVLIGIYLIVGRFFIDAYQRSRTYYGVTNQRVLILSGIWTREVKAISLPNLNEISLTERSDGSGDIVFGPMSPMYAMGRSGMNKNAVPAFELIENVRQVYDFIQQTQRKK
jgi:hypothetical protein